VYFTDDFPTFPIHATHDFRCINIEAPQDKEQAWTKFTWFKTKVGSARKQTQQKLVDVEAVRQARGGRMMMVSGKGGSINSRRLVTPANQKLWARSSHAFSQLDSFHWLRTLAAGPRDVFVEEGGQTAGPRDVTSTWLSPGAKTRIQIGMLSNIKKQSFNKENSNFLF